MGQEQSKPDKFSRPDIQRRFYSSAGQDTDSQNKNKVANEMLRLLLGPHMNDTFMQAAPPKFFEPMETKFNDREWEPGRRFYDMKFSPDVPEETKDLVSLLAMHWPKAATSIYNVFNIPDVQDKHGGLLGEWRPGQISIRSNNKGKPIPRHELISTILHEFSHSRGAPDTSLLAGDKRLGAYDIDIVYPRDIYTDIKLPPDKK